MLARLKRGTLFLLIAALFLEFDVPTFFVGGPLIAEAEARVGRPATPRSVAGVARRTTRRTVRRTARYVAALPGGCVQATMYGVVVWNCRGVYYQPYGGQYVVVVFD